MTTKEEAIDIVNKFDFFYGQRAGRELWFDKSKEVQNKDVENFHNDCEALLMFLQECVYNESITCC